MLLSVMLRWGWSERERERERVMESGEREREIVHNREWINNMKGFCRVSYRIFF